MLRHSFALLSSSSTPQNEQLLIFSCLFFQNSIHTWEWYHIKCFHNVLHVFNVYVNKIFNTFNKTYLTKYVKFGKKLPLKNKGIFLKKFQRGKEVMEVEKIQEIWNSLTMELIENIRSIQTLHLKPRLIRPRIFPR